MKHAIARPWALLHATEKVLDVTSGAGLSSSVPEALGRPRVASCSEERIRTMRPRYTIQMLQRSAELTVRTQRTILHQAKVSARYTGVWRLTGLFLEIVFDAIRLPLSLDDIFRALQRRSRHLVDLTTLADVISAPTAGSSDGG